MYIVIHIETRNFIIKEHILQLYAFNDKLTVYHNILCCSFDVVN